LSDKAPSRPGFGLAMAVSFVLIWAGWIIATRYAVQTSMTPAGVAIIRFCVAALFFLPWYWREGVLPKGVDRRLLFTMVVCAGVPYLLIVSSGMAFAPAADIGALLPGTLPLFTAILGWVVIKETMEPPRILGFVFIACGIILIAGPAVLFGADGAWRGHFLFLFGAFMWSIFTHAFKKTGLGSLQAAGLIGFWSLALVIPLVIFTGGGGLLSLSWQELGYQAVVQGFFGGMLSLVTYGLAVVHLGATRAAAFGSLVPALVALLAIPLLGEIPGWITGLAIGAITMGVLLASGQGAPILRRIRSNLTI